MKLITLDEVFERYKKYKKTLKRKSIPFAHYCDVLEIQGWRII